MVPEQGGPVRDAGAEAAAGLEEVSKAGSAVRPSPSPPRSQFTYPGLPMGRLVDLGGSHGWVSAGPEGGPEASSPLLC